MKIATISVGMSGTALRENPEHIATMLGIEYFTASNGWIDSFKQQHTIVYKTVLCEHDKCSLFTGGGMDRGVVSQNYGGLQSQEHF